MTALEVERQRKVQRPKKQGGTVTIAEAAAILGIGRNQGYEAVRLGQIPTIDICNRKRVPRAWLNKILSGELA